MSATVTTPQAADDRDTISSVAPADVHRIPDALNAAITTVFLAAVFACFHAAAALHSWLAISGLAAAFALLMMAVYCIIHEAEHGVLFSHPLANDVAGVITSAFFPAPFHLLRQSHLGHHLRNRSDDEAIDLWFEGESPLWKWVQWIGILIGFFYLIAVLGNVIVLALPFLLKRRFFKFDRPTAAFIDSLNPRYARIIQLEAAGVILLHVAIVRFMHVPIWHYVALYAAFGLMWSSLQYVHHFGTERHVTRGARNVWVFWPLDKLWLNHNWHRVHHEHPTVSWLHLERLGKQAGDDRTFLPWVYLRTWSGPRKANDHVANRFAGKVMR
jgi:fatty acid desaturase